MKPLDYFEGQQLLKAEISGNFPGSPLMLSYHFKFKDDTISFLLIDQD